MPAGSRLIVLQPTPYCNIACSYCYLGNRDDTRLMSGDVIDAVRDKLLARLSRNATPTVVWHAGEPTAAPIRWYEHAYDRLADAAPAGTSFSMQSNGIAIDERWIDLFRRTNTDVSISVDGPEHFHDQRRRTRNNKPTWALAVRGLTRLQQAGFEPRVITVLHPDGLDRASDYFDFYREHGLSDVSFSIDELEGTNRASSFSGRDHKAAVTRFLVALLELGYRSDYPLRVRGIERIAQMLAGTPAPDNELVEPWAAIVVAADGRVSTFSPELIEASAPEYGDFVFGNILGGEIEHFEQTEVFKDVANRIAAGVEACKSTCRYFELCGGGSPVNKFCEKGDLAATETEYCRLTTQAATDALITFLARTRDPIVVSPIDKTPRSQPNRIGS